MINNLPRSPVIPGSKIPIATKFITLGNVDSSLIHKKATRLFKSRLEMVSKN